MNLDIFLPVATPSPELLMLTGALGDVRRRMPEKLMASVVSQNEGHIPGESRTWP